MPVGNKQGWGPTLLQGDRRRRSWQRNVSRTLARLMKKAVGVRHDELRMSVAGAVRELSPGAPCHEKSNSRGLLWRKGGETSSSIARSAAPSYKGAAKRLEEYGCPFR